MKTIVRKNEEAVSPVIATILMVAITVVLAAVLYVMVSGLITSPGSTPTAWGVNVGRSTDGTNWTVAFTSVPASTAQATTFITVNSAGGAPLASNQALNLIAAGTCQGTVVATNKCFGMSYSNPSSGTLVGAGTTLLMLITAYPAGSTIQIVSGSSVVYTHALQ